MNRSARLLIVDDDEDHVYLAKESFARVKHKIDIDHVSNGVECMSFLRKEGCYLDARLPDIVLLDLNMPLMNGREVIKEIVADPQLNFLPIVVLSTSESDRDIMEAYGLRCNSYIVKPVDFNEFQRAITDFANYWFSIAVIPTRQQ